MRSSVFLFLVFFCASLQAQKQEARIEQILRPDPTRQYDFQQDKSYRSRSFSKSSKKAMDPKAAYLPQKFRAKDYLTGAYSGNKSWWAGDFKYDTKDAQTRSFFQSGKTHQTKEAATNAFAGQKNYTTSAVTAATREYLGPEAAAVKRPSDEVAKREGWKGNLQVLSIDDIRELLNKSK